MRFHLALAFERGAVRLLALTLSLAAVVAFGAVPSFLNKPQAVSASVEPAGDYMLAVLRAEHDALAEQVRAETRAEQSVLAKDDAQFRVAGERAQQPSHPRLAAVASARVTPATSANQQRAVRQHAASAVKLPARSDRPAGVPLQLASLAGPIERSPEPGFLKRQVDGFAGAVEQIPALVRHATGWLSRSMPSVKLPGLPEIPVREFLEAEM